LIELMIVVAIIAVVAAIAIPSLLRARMTSNQGNAGASLKLLVTAQSTWRSQDMDRNGCLDFWVRDVRAFYGTQDAGGNLVKLIDHEFANSDFNPAGLYGYAGEAATPIWKQGYRFQALAGCGNCAAAPSANGLPAAARVANSTDPAHFAFKATPAAYGADGILNFVVCEDGLIWQKDDNTAPTAADTYPANPSGNGWSQFGS
jgi:type II secretory pathway pseudopilin PulG